MVDEMLSQIGTAAGEVYRYLNDKGQATVSELRRELPLGAGRVDQAIGWLAREKKILFAKDKRSTIVSLRER